jgi:hypothetical protein
MELRANYHLIESLRAELGRQTRHAEVWEARARMLGDRCGDLMWRHDNPRNLFDRHVFDTFFPDIDELVTDEEEVLSDISLDTP